MMQLAVPKQNGCQKCVVQLDTKANERRGFRFPISSPFLRAMLRCLARVTMVGIKVVENAGAMKQIVHQGIDNNHVLADLEPRRTGTPRSVAYPTAGYCPVGAGVDRDASEGWRLARFAGKIGVRGGQSYDLPALPWSRGVPHDHLIGRWANGDR
jgi:hypothetical protein